MALLNRNRDQAVVPEEIQEYYQDERRERTGVAWVLAAGTLVMTILLAAGIFFGGRWAYRKIQGNDKPDTTQVAQESTENEQAPAPDPTPSSDGAVPPNPTPTPSITPTPVPPNAPPTPSPRPNAQPNTGDVAGTTTPLPSTGPAEVLGVFVSVTLAGYLMHRVSLRRLFS